MHRPLRPLIGSLLMLTCALAAWSAPPEGAERTRDAKARAPQPRARAAAAPTGLAAVEGNVGTLPAEVDAALQRAKVPREALSVVVLDVSAHAGGASSPEAVVRLSHQAQTAVNPASLMKLVTTVAAFDLLGPAYTWRTSWHIDGPVREGTLQGNAYLRGSGDPKLTVERLWVLMRRLQGLGIARIQGDIVLDRSAFEAQTRDPGQFDGEPLRPYNATPDALLINFKSLLVSFVPDRAAQVAQIQVEPPLSGVQLPASVPLSSEPCDDWRGGLRADWSDPQRVRFAGSYPAACGERLWPVAYSAPALFANRAIAGMWQQLGGQLSGQVREGTVPASLPARVVLESPTLTEVVRDINKFSNNVMAQQLFLTLGNGNAEQARQAVQRWWRERLGTEVPVLDNGSGLSRDERTSALGLARLLHYAWLQPTMPELMASLPLSGVDGTLRRSRAQAGAHLKTGSLRDVAGIAGYVDGARGQRWVLVAILNHPQAHAARPALEALVEWTARQP